jgi:SAM-dependent methyltransferase
MTNDFNSERFWTIVEPFMFDADRWNIAAGEIHSLLKLVEIPPNASVLDVACGPGRHSFELNRLGYAVLGVDANPGFINAARQKAGSDSSGLEFRVEDIRVMALSQPMQLAIFLFNSFGYMKSDENAMVLAQIWKAIDFGGKVVMSIAGKEVVARQFVSTIEKCKAGVKLTRKSFIRDGWTHLEQLWELNDDSSRQHFFTSQQLYSANELRDLLGHIGFSKIQIFGSLDGAPYDQDAKAMVALALK